GITAALARTAPPDYMDSLSRDDWWEIDSTKDSLGYVLRYTKMTHLRRSDSLLYEYVYYTEKLYTEPISTGWHADKTNLHINGNPTPSSYILTSDTLILTTDGTQKKYTHTMPSLLDPSVVGTWEDSITKISFKIESDGKVTFFKLATPTTGKEYSASSNGAFIYIYSLNSKNMAEYTPIAFKDGIAFDGINYYIKAQSGF
ncbi:MAG: hypothetical protein RL318_1546, partial [Fibrobacterota bacterium]